MTGGLFDICTPREDVRKGRVSEAEFAADLAQVVRGDAPPDYAEPERFLANTHPTRGLRNLLRAVLGRLSGRADHGAIFRLHTNFGGGKTHALIALIHAARSGRSLERIAEFVDPALLPDGPVHLAAVDGENADPVNGRPLPDGGRAYSLWGEIAYALGGRAAFEKLRRSDEAHAAPGADTLREVFPDGPVLILVDELAPYLRKLSAVRRGEARAQVSAFLTALCKAVEGRPRAALVLTLAVGKGGEATDAYIEENRAIFDELEAILARQATILNPTEDDETALVLRRRLFERIDDAAAASVLERYRDMWRRLADRLPEPELADRRLEAFTQGFPFHPELIETLREKTSSLGKFQRVRGMLRLLAHTTARLWAARPRDVTAIHTCHIDLAHEPIRQELTTRLERGDLVPALNADVAAGPEDEPATAQRIDRRLFPAGPPYGSYVARTVFVHTLAYPGNLVGIERRALRYAVLGPELDADFLDQAIDAFITEAAYLDDRPGAPLRFLAEPNLTQIVRRREREIDPEELRAELRERIRRVFSGTVFELVAFPGGPWDVSDEARGRPRLVLISHEAETVEALNPRVPELVRRIFRESGRADRFRQNRNHLVFVVADAGQVERMHDRMRHLLALQKLRDSPTFRRDLPKYQQERVLQGIEQTDRDIAIAIQSAYRHVFYPDAARSGLEGEEEPLGYVAIEATGTAHRPGDGQRALVQRLRDLAKLLQEGDQPPKPAFVEQRTPLRRGAMTTAALLDEFRRNPYLPMLADEQVFVRLLREGIEHGQWVYRYDELVVAKETPPAKLEIDEQAIVMTAAYAREHGIWPPPPPPPPGPTAGEQEGAGPEEEGGGGDVVPPPPPPPAESAIEKEGVLKEALAQLFAEARRRGWNAIGRLTLRPFEARDALVLTGLVATLPNATRRAEGELGYETRAGDLCEVHFEGSLEAFRPVREFLQNALRGTSETHADLRIVLDFDGGLPTDVESEETFVRRLTPAGAGAAQVTAIAEAAS